MRPVFATRGVMTVLSACVLLMLGCARPAIALVSLPAGTAESPVLIRVLDRRGDAVIGAIVRILDSSKTEITSSATDIDGKATIPGLLQNREYTVIIDAAGIAKRPSKPFIATGGPPSLIEVTVTWDIPLLQ